MPTPTYTALATTTLASATTSLTFSSIPATYRDLVVVVAQTTNTGSYSQMRLNGDTGANYPYVVMYTDPTIQTTSGTYNQFYGAWILTDGGTLANGIWQIMDYSATDKHKTVLARFNYTKSASLVVEAAAGRWANTSAVTSATIFGSFAAGSVFSIYGIAS